MVGYIVFLFYIVYVGVLKTSYIIYGNLLYVHHI
jgi:hypothetical protein